jgi:hypothetical protein
MLRVGLILTLVALWSVGWGVQLSGLVAVVAWYEAPRFACHR